MPYLPNPQAGQSWAEQSAREWRALSEEVSRLKGTIERIGLNKPSGSIQSEIERGVITVPLPKTVVIVAKPLAGDAVLTVRESRYFNSPPLPCTGEGVEKVCNYSWYGDPFYVYPPLGKEAVDYAGDEQVPADDTHPPKLDSVFQCCHRENDYWILDDAGAEGGGGFRFSSVPTNRIAPNVGANCVTGASTIDVQPLKRGTGTTYTNDGAQISVRLWGNQKGEDFYTLIGDIIPIVQVGSEWFALQYFWMYAKTPTGTKGDCGL